MTILAARVMQRVCLAGGMMGNILKVGAMWLFIPTGEPVNERPHVHFSRQGEDKRVNIKIWLGPDGIVVASKHKSFSKKDESDALKAVRNNYSLCLQEWARMYSETHKAR